MSFPGGSTHPWKGHRQSLESQLPREGDHDPFLERLRKGKFLTFLTRRGSSEDGLEAYSNPRTGGIIAINLDAEDELIAARLTDGNSIFLLATN